VLEALETELVEGTGFFSEDVLQGLNVEDHRCLPSKTLKQYLGLLLTHGFNIPEAI